MNRFPIATAAFALVLAAAGPVCVSTWSQGAWAQSAPPARSGTVPPSDKSENPVTPNAPQRGPAATLERLFQRLHDATTQEEAEGIARLIQRPIDPDKRKILVQAMGDRVDERSIKRVVQLVVSMPDYQLC